MAKARKKNYSRSILPVSMTLLVILLTWSSFAWSAKINLLNLEKIRIRGNNIVPDNEILGLLDGMEGTLFDFDFNQISEILEKHPYISGSRISRRFPHMIKVEVKERKPIARVNIEDLVLLDKDGIVLPAVPKSYEFSIPNLSGFNPEKGLYPVGKPVLSIKMKETIALLNKIRKNFPDLYDELSEVILNKEDEFTIILTTNPTLINLGDAEIMKKIVTLMAFEKSLGGSKSIYDYATLDLRYAKQIIAKEWS